MDDETSQEGTESSSDFLSNNSTARRGIDFGSDRTISSQKAARAVRFRIMTLMVLLLVVIFAMKEAGKPERWMWMGFDKIDQGIEAGDFLVDASESGSSAGSQSPSDWGMAKSASAPLMVPTESDSENANESAIGLSAAEVDRPGQRELDRKFWQTAYKRLTDEKQLQLFALLRKVVRSDFSELPQQEISELKKIIKRLTQEQIDFQTLALGEIALVRDAQEKKRRTETVFAFDQRWQTGVVPTLSAAAAGNDYTFAGQVEIRKIMLGLRPLFFDAVEDMSGMGTRDDLPGWMTVWDQVVAADPRNTAVKEVSFLQLSGQPQRYRGEQVLIKGRARTCKKKLLKQTQLPVGHYYEVWVEPTDADGDGLFCIYAAEIPDAFPIELLDRQHAKFHATDVPVSLVGRFFKVRSYRDSGGGVSHSPVVITRQMESTVVASRASVQGSPSAAFTALWFTGIAAVATGLVIVVFRTSRSAARSPGRHSTKRLKRSMELLQQDSSIKTPAERVAELAQAEETQESDQ